MKKTILIMLPSIWYTAICTQSSNPLDAAIKQIDNQSRELTQQVIANQQEGTARQKIARLELELATLIAEHTHELAELKKQYEEQINTLKKNCAQAQQELEHGSTSLAAMRKDSARVQHEANAQHKTDQALIAQLRAEITDLKRTQESKKPVAPQEPSLDLDEKALLDTPEQA